MRMSRIFDEGGGYYANSPDFEGPIDPGSRRPETPPEGPGNEAPAPEAPAPGAPTGATEPGPAEPSPPGQGNPPKPKPPTPPAVPSAIQGVKSNEATGGVGGTFGQAGSSEFSRRFGTPASWFRGGNLGDMLFRDRANRGRDVLGRSGGGGGGGTVVNPVAPSGGTDLMSGGKNDEQWQRLMAEVLKNRFGG